MAKVSVGLRGWRFDEDEVFTDDGEWAPLDEMSDDTRNRLLRLGILLDQRCDACYLEHGEAEKRRANPAAIVYGEPGDEVLLCDDHESDFLYWFRKEGGSDLTGEEEFRDEFHEWFVAASTCSSGPYPAGARLSATNHSWNSSRNSSSPVRSLPPSSRNQ